MATPSPKCSRRREKSSDTESSAQVRRPFFTVGDTRARRRRSSSRSLGEPGALGALSHCHLPRVESAGYAPVLGFYWIPAPAPVEAWVRLD